MTFFVRFGEMKEMDPSDERVQALVAELQAYITKYYYTCTKEILSSLGSMYSGGGTMTENIDRAGGEGTAEFADRAIRIFCN